MHRRKKEWHKPDGHGCRLMEVCRHEHSAGLFSLYSSYRNVNITTRAKCRMWDLKPCIGGLQEIISHFRPGTKGEKIRHSLLLPPLREVLQFWPRWLLLLDEAAMLQRWALFLSFSNLRQPIFQRVMVNFALNKIGCQSLAASNSIRKLRNGTWI